MLLCFLQLSTQAGTAGLQFKHKVIILDTVCSLQRQQQQVTQVVVVGLALLQNFMTVMRQVLDFPVQEVPGC